MIVPRVFPHSRLASHPWCLGSTINVGTVTDAFKDATASSLQSLLNRILFETYKSERCFKHFSFVMDPIDAFPEHLSTTVVPVTLPDKPVALEYAARQG
ncbi:hypothetical protein TNCV_4294621 [Trichonephila clavipes]|uniref:Uncharacterized protein n=1 Tax=Trichonephila clavipes TaxID=2585209 RepID=A0A8X6RL65_TRICX|nr:hypothetical protein TNCV_4294621 [Trichonephila clavipes]